MRNIATGILLGLAIAAIIIRTANYKETANSTLVKMGIGHYENNEFVFEEVFQLAE
jgi:hypothetical protein